MSRENDNRDIVTVENEATPEIYRPKFNWVAFIVMLIAVGIALGVGMLIPGILDEYIAIVIINIIYWFVQSHGGSISRK